MGTELGAETGAGRAEERDRGEGSRLAELGLVAAMVAHDLNNVLSVVSCCGALLRSSLGARAKDCPEIDDLDESVRHGSKLVRQVFDFARRKPRPLEDVDLNEVISGMGWMLRHLGGKGVEVSQRLADGLWPVRASEVQIEQLLLNLVINARDALPSGGRLTIVTENVSSPGPRAEPGRGLEARDSVRLTVWDNGPGMSAEVRERLFEPFFTTKKSGNGLGLTSVARIVRDCGGVIRLRSGVETGSAFEVYLPRTGSPGGAR